MKHYIKDALRTDGTWQHYADITHGNLDLQTMRLLHAAMGLMTEAIELEQAIDAHDQVNIREEIGDASWYFAIGWDACECKWGELAMISNRIIRLSPGDYVKALRFEINELLDEMKKHLFYNKDLPRDKVIQHLNMCRFFLENIAVNSSGVGYYEACLEANLRKLKVRYPEKFTTTKAIQRDILSEREELENGLA